MAVKTVEVVIKARGEGEDTFARFIAALDKAGVETGEFNQEAEQLRQRLKDIERQQALIDSFVKIKIEVGAAGKAMEAAQSNAQRLGKELSSTESPTRAQETAFKRARAAVSDTKDAYLAAQLRLQDMRGTLADNNIETTALASKQAALRNGVREVDSASAALRQRLQTLTPAHAQVAQASSASASQQVRDSKAVQSGVDGVRTSTLGTADLLRTIGPLFASAFSAQQFVQIIAAQESLDRSFEQIFGSAAKARTEMEFVRATANKLGIENQVLARSYQSLAASTKGTALEGQATREVFEAVARAMSTLGKSSAETDRALTAISQIASKGTASMEELRGQLGEALPGAMKAAADGAGITVEELVEMVSSGSVLASDILPALTKGLNDLYGKAEPPKTLVSEWARLKNIMTDTATAMGEGGASDLMMSGLIRAARSAVAFKDVFISTGVAVGETVAKITTGNTELGTLEDRLLTAADRQNALAGSAKDAAQAQAELTAAQQAGGDATQESFRKQELLAQKLEQTGASMLAVKAQYTTLTSGASDYTNQLEKNIAAHTADMAAVTQLVSVYGSEVEKRQAATQATELQATAAKELATAREVEAVIAQSLALRLQDEARKRGDTTEATRKEIEAAQKSAQAKRAEADQSAASAKSKVTEAEAAKASALAYQDNSARVFELRGAMQAASAEVERLTNLQREGKATEEQVATARSKLSAATLLYRDAMRDASEAAERKIASERQAAQIAQTTISVNLERVKALQAVAEANGDEARSSQLAQQATMLQVRAAEQAAAAARAEALAIREVADTKERELRATGELTTAKQAEIEAQRKSADLKDLEAQKADILAYKTRELAKSESARTDVLERQISAEEKRLELLERQDALERKRLGIDKEGFATDKTGQRLTMGGDLTTLTGVAAFLKSAGVDDDATARMIAKEFANEKGQIQYDGNVGQRKYGGSTISDALLKAAERYTFAEKNSATSTIPKPTQQVVTRNVNITWNNQNFGQLPTTEAGSDVVDKLLKAFQEAAGRS